MNFEEYRVKRRESLYGAIVACLMLVIWGIMLIVMYANDVHEDYYYPFFTRSNVLVIAFAGWNVALNRRNLQNIGYEHPEWIQKTSWKDSVKVTKEFILRTSGSLLIFLIIIGMMFSNYYRPNTKVNLQNLPKINIVDINENEMNDQIESVQNALDAIKEAAEQQEQ